MKLFKNYWVLVLIILFFACKNEDAPNPQIPCETSVATVTDAEKIIVGEWQWLESRIQGRAGETILTPSSENETRAFVFLENKTVRELLNNEVKTEASYQISTSSNTQQGALEITWITDNQEFKYYMNVCPDAMTLVDAVSSLATQSKYIKK